MSELRITRPLEVIKGGENNIDQTDEVVINPVEDFTTIATNRLARAGDSAELKLNAIEDLCSTISREKSRIRRDEMIELLAKLSGAKKAVIKSTVNDLIDEETNRVKTEAASLGLQDGVNEDEAIEFGIYEYKNRYWGLGKFGKYEISNFTMTVLYHVKTSADTAYRLIEIRNVFGKTAIINLNTDDFVSLGPFKKVIARHGNFIFKGMDSDLGKLQEKLQRDERPTLLVQTLGYNKRGSFYAFANGIVACPDNCDTSQPVAFFPTDEFGIIALDEKNYFIPADSKIFEDKDNLFSNDKKFRYIANEHCDFQKWAQLDYKVYGEKAIIGQLYCISAMFRDIIFNAIGRRFPILNCYGQRGSGKGTFIESFMWLFGKPQDQIMLGGASTTVGFMRKFAAFSNAIVWLDEYKNNLQVKMIESLKNIYDGIGYERGKKDNTFETESTPINSACILSGQEMPTAEPALFTRVIMLSFKPGKGFTDDDRRNFKDLQKMQEKYLTHITANIVRHRSAFIEHYKTEFETVFPEIIKRVNNKEIDERMMLNIAVLATTHKVAEKFLKFPFTYEQAEKFLIKNLKEQFTILSGSDDIAKWWQVVENLFSMGIIKEGVDFELADGYLFLRIQNVHPHYQKELRSRNDPHALDKSTLEHYVKMDASVYVDCVRKRFRDGSNTWAYKFIYRVLNIDLIRITDEAQADAKYLEMQMDLSAERTEPEEPVAAGGDDDLPF
jgi:hypothetical protein